MKLESPSHKVLAGLLALALLVVLAVIFRAPGDKPAAALSRGEADASSSKTPNSRADLEKSVVPAEERRVAAETAPSELPAATVTGKGELTLSGTIQIEGPGGGIPSNASGSMYLSFDYGNGVRFVSTPVRGGNWSVSFDRMEDGNYVESGSEDPMEETHFAAGFQNSLITATSIKLPLPFPVREVANPTRFMFGAKDAVVMLQVIRPVQVIVEDTQTGAPLSQVTLLETTGVGDHPGDNARRPMAEAQTSPIELDPETTPRKEDQTICWVGSPGYAWAVFELDFDSTEPHRVQLERGGDLEVILEPPARDIPLVLHVLSNEARTLVATHTLPPTGSVSLTGLPPDEYEVRLVLQGVSSSRAGASLARGKTVVVAGGTERVILSLDLASHVKEASVSGKLVLPQSWGLELFSVRVDRSRGWESVDSEARLWEERRAGRRASWDSSRARRGALLGDRAFDPTGSLSITGLPMGGGSTGRRVLDQSSFERAGADTFTFDLGPMPLGLYEMTLLELGTSIQFDVGPEGRSDILLVVPEPAWVTVRTRDLRTGEAVFVSGLAWSPSEPGSSGTQFLILEEKRASEFLFQVPQGEILLESLHTEGLAQARERVEVDQSREVVLDVRRSCGVELELRDGEDLLPWPEHSYPTAKRLDGSGDSNLVNPTPQGIHIVLPAPGRYRILIPELHGFRPHEAIQVEVAEGATAKVVVQLSRLF